ncbi:MAG: hypothetical protein ACR2P4_06450 [Gammaproteobacteria bacterium]
MQALIFALLTLARVVQTLIFDFCAFAKAELVLARVVRALINAKSMERRVMQRQPKAKLTRAKPETLLKP